MQAVGLMFNGAPENERASPSSTGTDDPPIADAIEPPDSDLAGDGAEVARARAGEPVLWEQWFHRFYPRLFRYAYIRLRSRVEAEDMASQVFVEALRGIAKFQYTGRPVLSWLYRIEHNLIYDRLASQSRQPKITEPGADAVDTRLESMATSIDLRNAIQTLPDEQRQVIILRYFMALSAQDAARIMRKTSTAVYSLQARALVNLRKHLVDERG